MSYGGGSRDSYQSRGSDRGRSSHYGERSHPYGGGGGDRRSYGGGGGGGRDYGRSRGGDRGYGRDRGYGGRDDRDFYSSNGGGKVSYDSTPFIKSFFDADSIQRSGPEIATFRQNSEIRILRGEDKIPPPIFQFEEGGFPREVMDHLLQEGFKTPTAIQSQGWSIALSGLNLVAIAMTGSGKTLGYLLPAVIHAANQKTQSESASPQVIVMAPTRELAMQIGEVSQKLGSHFRQLRTVCVYGGASKYPQIQSLRSGCEIAVCTPGRLIDLVEAGKISLRKVTYVVLDEADRMLDMGFEPQIRKILKQIRPDRQMLMWSATWPKSVQKLAGDFLGSTDYIHVNIGSDQLTANHDILQIIDVCSEYEKTRKMVQLFNEILGNGARPEENKIIVFAQTKRKVDEMTQEMRQNGYSAKCIHGDKSQEEREFVLQEFRQGQVTILVATDVAARGLDVDDVKFVINYDYPSNSEEYIHRIGRTGRKGQSGTAYTFFEGKNGDKARDLIQVLQEAKQAVNPKLQEIADRFGGGGGGGRSYGSRGRGGGGYRNGW